MSQALGPSTSSELVVLGHTEPRLWTAPLRELTEETSYGFDVIAFADEILGMPLDPWQQWLVIHLGELLPDGRPRFRKVLVLVARQQGKTHLLVVLTLFWLFLEQQKLVLSTSTTRDYAKESWAKAVDMAEANENLAYEINKNGVRRAIGEETLTTTSGCRYKIAASNAKGGRSLSIDRLVIDELREHHTFEAWNAAAPATNARPNAQIVCITNQGDEQSIVLDSLRTPALAFIESGVGDVRLGLFEWSAPPGADPTDPEALAAANPNLGHRTDIDSLMGDAVRAKQAGGKELAGFRTEMLCQRVDLLDPAIDPDAWKACGTDEPIDLAQYRDRVALCLDVSPDMQHATLMSAVVVGSKTHCEIVETWDSTAALRASLPSLIAKVKPVVLGWFPMGPTAAVAAQIAERKGNRQWPPRGVKIEELRGEVGQVCMGLAEVVSAGELEHPRDEVLDQQVRATQKLVRGDTWVFTRDTTIPIDAVYALAGAVHLARTMRPPRPPLSVVSV